MAQVRQRRGEAEPAPQGSPAPAPAPAREPARQREPEEPSDDWLSRRGSNMVLVILFYVLVCTAVFVWFQVGRPPPKLFVLSVGGLRHDYLSLVPPAQLPFFTQFVRYGARAEWLNPTFPSDGVATRASVFTGLYPDKHGIFGEHFLDREQGELKLRGPAGQSSSDAAWWGGVVPLWNSAVKQWRRTAVVNVDGACVAFDGYETTFCQTPAEAGDFEASLTLVLDRLIQEENPYGMAIVHTDALRRAAEQHGATSDGLLDELRQLDKRLQRLDRALLARQARDKVNVVIVSDGGLTDTANVKVISVDELLPDGAPVTLAGNGASVLGYMAAEDAAAAAALAANTTGVRAYLRGAMPARMRLEHPHREPDLLFVAEPGFYLENERPLAVEAAGGYDDSAGGVPDMRGVLLARGPSFRAGATVQQANAVDVYSLLAALTEVTSEVHSGQLSNVEDMVQW